MTIRDIAVAIGFDVDESGIKELDSKIKKVVDGISKEVDSGSKQVGKTVKETASQAGKSAEDSAKSSGANVKATINDISSYAKKLLGKIAVVFSVTKIASFAKDCVQAASDVEEMENKFNVVFDGINEEVDAWAEHFADSVGRNKNTIKGYLADQQNLLVGFGMTRQEGAALSEQMTTLALDIASFANMDEDQAVSAMTKAVMGQSEAAKTLGAVLNDTTRAETMAAMGLEGAYSSLDTLTQMQVNYNTILRQSPDAVGDCVRSIDSYEARQRQLNSAVAEFKEFVGGQLLPIMSILTGWITQGVKAATSFAKAILLDAEGNNRLLLVFERIQAIIKKLQPAMERFATAVRTGIERATGVVKNIADKLGGMENLFKILAIAAAAFFVVSNWSKIIAGAKSFMTLLSGLSKLFGTTNLKTLAIVAAVVLLALIVEDFINFLKGNDSVIGTIFDKAGIGADNAREAIINAWTKVKEFLLEAWDTIKQMASMTWDSIKAFFERHGSQIRATFQRVWSIISTLLNGVWTFISQLAATLFGDTEDAIDGSTQSTKDKVLAVWQAILDTLSAVFDAIFNAADTVFNALLTVIEFVFNLIQQFWSQWGSTILSWFKTLWDALGRVLGDFLGIVEGVANFIKSVFTGDWEGAWNSIKDIFSAVWDIIVTVLTAAWDTIKMVFSIALYYVKALWEKIWNGIKDFFSGILDWIEEKTGLSMDGVRAVVSGALQNIKTIFTTIWNNIKAVVQGAWEIIKAIVQNAINIVRSIISIVTSAIHGDWDGVWNGIKDIFSSIWETMKTIVSTVIETIKTVISNTWNAVVSIFTTAWNTIVTVVTTAWENLKTIVSTAISAVSNTISSVWNTIKATTSSVWSAIKTAVTSPIESAKATVTSIINSLTSAISSAFNAIKSTATSIWNSIKTAITTPITNAKNTVSSMIEAIKSKFNFSWSLPHLKLPHVSISGSFSLVPPKVPSFSISWYKKGGILDGAQIFGAAGGNLLGGGEAGKEAVLPLSELWTNMRAVMQDVLQSVAPEGITVKDFLPDIVNGISTLTSAVTAKVGTAAATAISSKISNITQNVNIDNTYNGGSAEAQKAVSRTMKKSATDATTEMARGLAYAR